MGDDAVTAFWETVKRDAAVQEKALLAAKQAQPLRALARVAAEAGFELTPSALQASLGRELTDEELEASVGGVAGAQALGSLIEARVRRFAGGEWFAE